MKLIVWDIDDVLNDLLKCWFEDFNQSTATKKKKMAYKDLSQNPPYAVLGITRHAFLASLDKFRISKKGRNLTPNPQILEWLRQYGSGFRHMALTSRPRKSMPMISEWLFRHFGDWIRTVSFVPSFRKMENLPVYDGSKSEFLKWFKKADFFIDDTAENVKAAELLGIKAFEYPQPWNGSPLTAEEIFYNLSKFK